MATREDREPDVFDRAQVALSMSGGAIKSASRILNRIHERRGPRGTDREATALFEYGEVLRQCATLLHQASEELAVVAKRKQ